MQASVIRIDEFIADKRTLVIPVYQRNYDWTTANCRQLFDDLELIAKNGKEHFIGTFVYQYKPVAGIFQEFVIIDGQQRITTIVLFAKAIYDMTDDNDLKEDIHSTFIKHDKGALKGKCKLRLTEYDRETFEKLMSDDVFDENNFTAQEKSSAMYKNYLFLRENIDESNLTLRNFNDAIYQLKVVSILLQDENPQEIFESLNSTGLDLSQADLIRNSLLMPLDYARQEELYKAYWLKLEELLRPTGNVENFFVQYLIAKLKTNDAYSSKVTPKKLYNLFKKFFDNECTDTESCLKDLLRYSKFFHGIIFNGDTDFDKLSALDKKFYELVHLLEAKKSPIILMYLLDRYEQQHFDEATFIKFVDALISLAFRAKVCKRSGITQQFAGNVLARLDKEIILDTNKFWRALIDSSSVAFPRDKDFQEYLINGRLYESIKSDGCKYLLYWLERATRAKELPSYAEATVEHVFPQKPNDSWKKYLKERNDYQTTEGLLHTLGNLTLTAYNSELGNEEKNLRAVKFFVHAGFDELCRMDK